VRLLVALVMLPATAALAAESPIRSIAVAYDGETYVVTAVMFAPVTQAVAWEVLTDFDHMSKWVPNVTESKVLKRDEATVTVEQRGTAKFGAASFPYVTERRIDMKPSSAIKTTQVKGSLKKVESSLALGPDGKGTKIDYRLEIIPSFLTAAIMSQRFLEHEVTEQFTAIVGEMVRRAP
jgi:ribosome-associated toxin RatA of RatAB toxin-antitoxin module